jgi:mono/diheme cytochrome c family protein
MNRNLILFIAFIASSAVLLAVQLRAPIHDGAELYLANCSACHGVYGEGDGPVSQDLSVALQDLRYIAQRNGGVFPREIVTAIVDGRDTRATHGPTDMPVWGEAFSRTEGYDAAAQQEVDERITALVNFLSRVQLSPGR